MARELFPLNVPWLEELKFSDLAYLNGLVYLDSAFQPIGRYLSDRGLTGDVGQLPRPVDSRFRVNYIDFGPSRPMLVLIGGVITPGQIVAMAEGQVIAFAALDGISRYWLDEADVILAALDRWTNGEVLNRDLVFVGHSGGGAVAVACAIRQTKAVARGKTEVVTFGAPCVVNDAKTAGKGLPNHFRFVNVGDAVPGLPNIGLAEIANIFSFLGTGRTTATEYFQFAGGIALDNGTYRAPIGKSWANERQRLQMAHAWYDAVISNRPTSHDIRAYIARLQDAERFTVVAEAHGVIIPKIAPDPEQNYIMPFALSAFSPRAYSFSSSQLNVEARIMIVIPKTDKAVALQLGTEFWVLWEGLQLFRCPTLGKARTSAKRWNLLLYHIGTRGGIVSIDTLKTAWSNFLDNATTNPSFKPQWVSAS